MNKVVSTLLAALLTMLVSTSAFAATSADGGDTVLKTFELTILGDVPANEAFVIGFLEEGEDPATGGTIVLACADFGGMQASDAATMLEGMDMDAMDMGAMADMGSNVDIISDQPCKRDTTYSYEVEFPRGTGIAYFFLRVNLSDPENFEIITSSDLDEEGNPTEFEELNEDIVNAVEYDFDAAQSQLPGTGIDAAGRFGVIAAALALVAMGGLVRRFLPQV
jgi:hypothetical protein